MLRSVPALVAGFLFIGSPAFCQNQLTQTDIAAAEVFIQTNLTSTSWQNRSRRDDGGIDVVYYTWRLSNFSVFRENLSWKEEEIKRDCKNDLTCKIDRVMIEYSVKISDLILPVRLDNYQGVVAIVVECRVMRCISGSRRESVGFGLPFNTEGAVVYSNSDRITQRSNWFPVGEGNLGSRLARAFGDILSFHGASFSRY